MPALFYYLAPKDMVMAYAAVTGGPTDSAHQAAWLTDLRPNRPVLSTTGSPAWSVPVSGGPVNFVCAANTNLDDGQDIDLSDDVTATLTVQRRADQTTYHPWAVIPEVASPSNINVGIVGNSQAVRFGEFFAGYARTIASGSKPGVDKVKEYRVTQPGSWSSVPRYDIGQDRWRWAIEISVTAAERLEIQAWEESTYRGTLPSVVVDDVDINDCKVVQFLGFSERKLNPNRYELTLSVLEYARTRWTA